MACLVFVINFSTYCEKKIGLSGWFLLIQYFVGHRIDCAHRPLDSPWSRGQLLSPSNVENTHLRINATERIMAVHTTQFGQDLGWPYVSGLLLQLYDDIKHINITDISLSKGWHWFTHAEPLLGAIAICIFFMIWCYVVSLISGNYSQVDKLWPIMPMVYAWYFALEPIFSGRSEALDPRTTLMACCITLWGLRLAYNYSRKGGYSWKHEDYRWIVVRKKMGFVLFQILNATFIAVIQNIIILWCVTPIYLAWLNRGTPLNTIDYISASLFLTFWLIEVVADQQQWNFHQIKKRNNSNIVPGFMHTGLFRYSRHPNFFGEMSLWWSFYLFSLAATQPHLSPYQSLFNWTGIGALCLTGLFQGSTTLTEQISNAKYPEYKAYQATTSRIIPWFAGSFSPSRLRTKQA